MGSEVRPRSSITIAPFQGAILCGSEARGCATLAPGYLMAAPSALDAFACQAGFTITVCEELFSHRRSQPGPRAKGKNRALTEFPAISCVRP